jgi:ferritin-like metal-binding protein YciE
MADVNERDAKLIQYLSEAHGKERELETSLQAHILMTTKKPYEKRLKEHLRETKRHARELEKRIKKLGGASQITQVTQTAVGKAMAAAKGPLHMLRGSGEQEKMLKNAKTEYFNEHEEIATYLAIEVFAEKVGDRETAKLAKGIRREEERMAKFLEGQIKSLSRAVVSDEIPRALANGGRSRRKSTRAKPKAKSRAKAKTRSSKSRSKAKPRAKAKPRSRAKAKRARTTARSGRR